MRERKVVLVTGGAGRIGSALAFDLINQGYKVLLGDIVKKKLIKIKKKINSSNLEIFCGDLTKKNTIEKFINYGVKKFKKIDCAVHCSYPKSKKWGVPFEKVEERYLNQDLSKQLGGAIIFSQSIIKYFLRIKSGNLILISSILGLQPPKFENYKSLNINSPIEYTAIKSGIIAITKYISKYYQKKNIRINCVSPGGIKANQPRRFINRYRKYCNFKGLLDGSDVSKLIIFLISEKSKYISGQNIVIDDGWSL